MATIINHNRPATDKQLAYIRNFIEPWSEVPFTGTTCAEASDYIDRNKADAELAADLAAIELEALHGNWGDRD